MFREKIFEVLEYVIVSVMKKKNEGEIEVCVSIYCDIGDFDMFCCW